MSCPRCGDTSELNRVDEGLYEDIETHVCRQCGGTFYPSGSLDRLDDCVTFDVERMPLRPRTTEPAMRCPAGHASPGGSYRTTALLATLSSYESVDDARVRLAKCDECGGFWLERGVLDRLRALALELSGQENRPLNERAKKEDERRERERDGD